MPNLPDIDALTAQLRNLPFAPEDITAAVVLAVGVLYCFLGYRTIKFLVGVSGFALAGAVAGTLAAIFAHDNWWVVGGTALFGGICGAFALLFLYRAGIFFVGVVGASMVAQGVLSAWTFSWEPWAIVAAGLAGGLVALLVERAIISVATAAIGAWVVVCAGAFFLVGPAVLEDLTGPSHTAQHGPIMISCWAGLALAGAVTQVFTGRQPRPTEKEQPA